MKLIIAIFLLISGYANAKVDCNKHKIYCKIKQLRPNMNNSKAMNLSNTLYIHSRQYSGDPILAVAIAMQETSLRYKNREQNVIQFYQECDDNGICHENWHVIRGASDICMFQFHVNTILYYNIDPIKLKNDISYCVNWHFRLMAIKKKQCRKIEKPWACYHSKNKKLQRQYIELVEAYL